MTTTTAPKPASSTGRRAPAAKPEPGTGDSSRSSGPREGSAMHGAITVLKGKRTPMHVNEIWAEMVERGLHTSLKGKTPEATLGAQLAVHAKKGELVERPEPGRYKLLRSK